MCWRFTISHHFCMAVRDVLAIPGWLRIARLRCGTRRTQPKLAIQLILSRQLHSLPAGYIVIATLSRTLCWIHCVLNTIQDKEDNNKYHTRIHVGTPAPCPSAPWRACSACYRRFRKLCLPSALPKHHLCCLTARTSIWVVANVSTWHPTDLNDHHAMAFRSRQ